MKTEKQNMKQDVLSTKITSDELYERIHRFAKCGISEEELISRANKATAALYKPNDETEDKTVIIKKEAFIKLAEFLQPLVDASIKLIKCPIIQNLREMLDRIDDEFNKRGIITGKIKIENNIFEGDTYVERFEKDGSLFERFYIGGVKYAEHKVSTQKYIFL